MSGQTLGSQLVATMKGLGLEQMEVFHCERAEDVGPSFDYFLRDRVRIILFIMSPGEWNGDSAMH